MKQNVTIERINELTNKQLVSLINLIYKRDYKEEEIQARGDAGLTIKRNIHSSYYFILDISNILTIGKMIEILKNKHKDEWANKIFFATMHGDVYEREDCLCDCLWEAVKEIL